MAFLRVWVILLLILLVVWAILLVAIPLRRRAELIDEWEAGPKDGDRAAFVREGMAQVRAGLALRLFGLVVALPLAALAAVLYLANQS